MNEEQLFTLSIFTENHIGLLNRITIIFTRRHLNIESITASESEVKNIFRYTIIVRTNREQVNKVVAQIDKLVEVVKAFVHEEDEVIYQELALYKVGTNTFSGGDLERIIRNNHARIIRVETNFLVIEKTGHKDEIDALFQELSGFEILEFACSGRVAVTQPMKNLTTYLKELDFFAV